MELWHVPTGRNGFDSQRFTLEVDLWHRRKLCVSAWSAKNKSVSRARHAIAVERKVFALQTRTNNVSRGDARIAGT